MSFQGGTQPQSQVIANGLVSGSTDTIPSFVAANGPVREARFPFSLTPTAPPTSITRTAASRTCSRLAATLMLALRACSSLALSAANANLIFRIPTRYSGSGLIANIDDSTLLNNQAAQAGNAFGVAGAFDRNGNEGQQPLWLEGSE